MTARSTTLDKKLGRVFKLLESSSTHSERLEEMAGQLLTDEEKGIDLNADDTPEFARQSDKMLAFQLAPATLPRGRIYTRPKRQPDTAPEIKVGRNAPCPCGSGMKFKKCCLYPSQPKPAPDNAARLAAIANQFEKQGGKNPTIEWQRFAKFIDDAHAYAAEHPLSEDRHDDRSPGEPPSVQRDPSVDSGPDSLADSAAAGNVEDDHPARTGPVSA